MRRLCDLHGRVKRARAVVAGTPGLAKILAEDWRKAARFYARHRITEHAFCYGVAAVLDQAVVSQGEQPRSAWQIPSSYDNIKWQDELDEPRREIARAIAEVCGR